jgi:hypothetical protein
MRDLNLMSAIFTHNMFNITGTQSGRFQSKCQTKIPPGRNDKRCRKQGHSQERNVHTTNQN